MRFLHTLANDVRYQVKYGFYLLYVIVSAVYVGVLLFCPAPQRPLVASVIVLTDPAMLGTFFIGGIWLLERGEGLHRYWSISPQRPAEYILAKAASLGLVSSLAVCLIAGAGLGGGVHYAFLATAVFAGSLVFTILGLVVASYAKSLNHYLLLVVPLEVLVLAPALLAAFGISFHGAGLLPGTALWHLICISLNIKTAPAMGAWAVILVWLAAALAVALWRIPAAMQREEGEQA